MTETLNTILEDWTSRAERATEAARKAHAELRDLQGDRPVLAVAATEGDQEAREQLAELDRKIAERRKDAEIAEEAQAEARRIVEGERRRAEQERVQAAEEERRSRYDDIAARREDLEKTAQNSLDSLVGALDELSALDTEQRAAAKAAGVQGVEGRTAWKIVTGGWIAGWLRPHCDDLPFRPDAARPLVGLDTMPQRAMAPEEIAVLQEERAEEMRARRTEEERRLDKIEWVQAVDNRRWALLAQTSHESSPPSIKKDIEVEVERRLGKEFPAYEPRGISKTRTGDDA